MSRKQHHCAVCGQFVLRTVPVKSRHYHAHCYMAPDDALLRAAVHAAMRVAMRRVNLLLES